jgi:pimeloyl-ACP methyl ester carboxylesterase
VREAARPRVLKVLEENLPRFRHFDGSVAVRQLSSSDIPRSERLAEINVPTLVVAGERDNVDARANYDNWARGIRNARKIVFPNAAHLVNIDQPQGFNRAILEFLGSL